MPLITTFLTTFEMDWVALAIIAALGIAYITAAIVARKNGVKWSWLTTVAFFGLGLGSYAAVSFGFLGAYTYTLRWAEIARWAMLLFLVPWMLSLGRPVALARAAFRGNARATLDTIIGGRVLRIMGNAALEPLFTVAVFMLFVTPYAGWLRLNPVPQNLATVLIPLFGLLTVIPIAEHTRRNQSITLTYEFMAAMGALIFDALPGILLRLHYFVIDGILVASHPSVSWFPNPLHDQHLAGDFIWFIAEAADIPIVIILFLRWARTDEREAKVLGTLSDEEMEDLTQRHLERFAPKTSAARQIAQPTTNAETTDEGVDCYMSPSPKPGIGAFFR